MSKEVKRDAVLAWTENSEGLGGLLSSVLAQTQVIQTADNATDSKANNLMAAALVIVALLGTLIKGNTGSLQPWAIASMGVMVLVVFLVIYLTRGREYLGAVVDLNEHKEYFSLNNKVLLAQLIEDANNANDNNLKILDDKQNLFRYAIIIFLVGFSLGLGALFVYN